MADRIPVRLPQRHYDIAIAPSALDGLGEALRALEVGARVLLVSNSTVFERYGERAMASLEAAGLAVARALLPDGERYKTLASVQQLYDAAFEHRLERDSTVVALGGGVVGDAAGFAAATWLRGVNVVQVPTSLLAMVDAAIGGKTGVNHPQGKNLIGAFHQPRHVLIDPQLLQTLPLRELRSGMAEVIKYGAIWDAELFAQLERAPGLASPDQMGQEQLQSLLVRSCQAKAQVVSQDETEAGLRAVLNYGHTVGHGIERLTGYSALAHGEAVAIGMEVAGQLAVELDWWSAEAARRQTALIRKAQLPTQIPGQLSVEAILDALQADKKVKAGRVRFVLPTQIGAATVSDRVSPPLLTRVLQQNLAPVAAGGS
ncbi:MAG: 3-dehydroquinate synthase [Cyanobacteria bacterium QS_8_64_29]|nr:MAG: 3-dehydroquinate synthase [Cyanobacteria bacterium QS_8_64_29]